MCTKTVHVQEVGEEFWGSSRSTMVSLGETFGIEQVENELYQKEEIRGLNGTPVCWPRLFANLFLLLAIDRYFAILRCSHRVRRAYLISRLTSIATIRTTQHLFVLLIILSLSREPETLQLGGFVHVQKTPAVVVSPKRKIGSWSRNTLESSIARRI